jgi:ornithine decarboxylase antizyme 1
VSRWALGLRGVPDAAHSSWDIPEGTGVGQKRNPSDPASHGLDLKTATLRIHFRVSTSPNYISVKGEDELEDTEGGHAGLSLPGWEAVLWRGRLYVSVSTEQLCHGSKEAFVSLLEYAEDVLHCEHVIVCLDKKTTKPSDTKMAIRNFLFLGFQPLAPGHEFVPSNPNLVCFVYSI